MLLFLDMIPYMIVFIFGIVVGSFLNVCIYRLPLHESIVTAPSHCMSCGNQLSWYDMVPVFSWIVLGGRCRNCKAKISVQYPLIEVLNGVLCVVVFVVNGWNAMSVIYCLMTSGLIVLSVIDWRSYEIPFSINVYLLILGIAAVAVDLSAWQRHLIGAVCVSGVLTIIYEVSGGRAIGGGDVKLMFSCGLILGWKPIILSLFLSCIIASVIHLILIHVKNAGKVLAMGPYLSVGIFIAALWGNQWINWYLSLLCV